LFAKANAAGGTSTIDAQLTVAGGTIRILDNIGTLNVKKDFYWMGGTFQATVDCAFGGGADQITVEKKLYVGGTATLQVLTLNYDPLIGIPGGFRRRVVYAREGIANVVPNMPPSLGLQNPAGGPTFQLDLRSNVDRIGDGEYSLIPG
jgi:hypothetical protein